MISNSFVKILDDGIAFPRFRRALTIYYIRPEKGFGIYRPDQRISVHHIKVGLYWMVGLKWVFYRG
jgi:hypothetical protein